MTTDILYLFFINYKLINIVYHHYYHITLLYLLDFTLYYISIIKNFLLIYYLFLIYNIIMRIFFIAWALIIKEITYLEEENLES